MNRLHIIDETTKNETFVFDLFVNEPFNILFVKDRQTKQRYIMVREKDADPFDMTKCQLLPVPYCQYDSVDIQLEKI